MVKSVRLRSNSRSHVQACYNYLKHTSNSFFVRNEAETSNFSTIGLYQKGTTSFWNVPKIILNYTDLYSPLCLHRKRFIQE